jgi:hypothetical protein
VSFYVRNDDLGTAPLEQKAAGVLDADGGAYGVTFGQQLGDYGATGSSGGAGYKDLWISHGRHFNEWYDMVPTTNKWYVLVP